MKNFIIPIAAAAVLFAGSCKNSDELVITGRLENPGDVKKVLLYRTDSLVDSAFLNESSEFKFRRSAPEADFYTLQVGEKNFLVIGQNGEEISLTANLADTSGSYKIEGSDESKKIQEVNKIQADYSKIYQDMQDKYSAAVSANPLKKDSIFNATMPEFQKNMANYSAIVYKFAQENKDNLAGFYAIGTIDQQKYELELIKYAEEVKTKFPQNKSVQSFADKYIALKPVSVGQPAPDFELSTPDNRKVKLSDFKGKLLLLDFWASWCGPCREENPNIVKQYQAFKDKGFDVLGVSLDDNRADWVNAIKADQLTWTHVSDLKRWESPAADLYHVDGIPASFILDRNGKIVAKNLRGHELEEFLRKSLN